MLIGTGFSGALTLVFFARRLLRMLTPVPELNAHFSPKGGCADAVVRELNHSRHEILMQAYSFTCPQIADALIAAKKRGVHVTILLDRSNEQETYSELKMLEEHNLRPLIDDKHAIAHNKIMIIDKKTLITGSFNFTRQAENENAENLLILKGHPELVQLYRMNFLAHQAHSAQPGESRPAHAAHDHHRRAA
jgi:phosphatidylserine/phosphatidylglycerophosphate/cardiolipin synthase-like enzyme